MLKTTNTITKARAAVLAGLLTVSLAACGGSASSGSTSSTASSQANASSEVVSTSLVSTASDGLLNTADMFTERDLAQTADTSSATKIEVKDGENVNITQEGVYVLQGSAANVTVTVEADSSAKVQLVLDGVTIKNDSAPAIYVKSADKVFVTTAKGSTNELSVTGTFAADGETNLDATIFSKDDLVLNGQGSLAIKSTGNGISSHDDLKITGGTYTIESQADALEANDNVLIADGTFTITSQKDGIHAENDEDNTTGNVYIAGGTLTITATEDAIQATVVAQIDGGILSLNGSEAIEGTYVQINGGSATIEASDDGINATAKSTVYTPTIEVRNGDITIKMAQGDTDALDANGNIYISGGTLDISGQSAFDYDGAGELTGGTVYVNGEQVTELTNQMMGGGMGGPGGGMGFGGMGGRGGGQNMGGGMQDRSGDYGNQGNMGNQA